ncbi:MAG: putative glycosyltransferase involved in cell wall biogenesis [Candidatus Desulfovibrio kirbyi]|jgi:cellulose synthase/poly-beta-1,6-N-acetylglucosamine synthase-like glycosyltransferase|uniref:Putative glycosyltransferase involved in cell wall biogenesis n=1 Tax=Candidatus Desulfovibrio kirbyi TaxID=2696086 RepID=A0A6L2R6A3_9BACT|nr:glycosyltransferase [Desulfovibrio sp.]GFH63053.1 MAG: putative glycosyltransferase involved in cell wall biogenesis [Candidatus Desulfovibrio kirbyi]
MTLLLLCLGALQCCFLYYLARAGYRLPAKALEDEKANNAIAESRWPRAALIVPVAGAHPHMATALKSFLVQDYPCLQPIFVTATAEEPAAELIRGLQKEHASVRHVMAGLAQACGQKNHNSLRGVAAADDGTQVYVFCDSTHPAQPDFIKHLLGPIVRGESAVTTGYHSVEPRDRQCVTLAYALCVLLMRLLQAVPLFGQLWGGAMAMSRTAFMQYGVADLWSRNVVDDCSLTGMLLRHKARIRICPGALLRTEAAALALPVWRAWMDRQTLFLKFCVPALWPFLGVFALCMFLPEFLAVLALAGGALNIGSPGVVAAAMAYSAVLLSVLYFWRNFFTAPISLSRLLPAFVCATGMLVFVYLRGMVAGDIVWHGIAYTVGKGGRVLRMTRA